MPGPARPDPAVSMVPGLSALAALAVLAAPLAVVCSGSSPPCTPASAPTLLGGRTAYGAVRGREEGKSQVPSGCSPAALWQLVLPGASTPHEAELAQLAALEDKLADVVDQVVQARHEGLGSLCLEVVQSLSEAALPPSSSSPAERLTSEGRRELQELGRRVRARYPGLFSLPFFHSAYLFRRAPTDLAFESATWFARGLFGHSAKLITVPVDGRLHSMHSMCPVRVSAVLGNESTRAESTRFEIGREVAGTIARVSDTLGLGKNSNLTFEVLEMMWLLCGYERAWAPSQPSAWCSAFTTEDLQVMQYHEDLREYYLNGYGTELNVRLGCVLVRDVLERFSAKLKSGNKGVRAIFYFSSPSVLKLTLLHLGIALEPDARHIASDNFSNMHDRQWNMSNIQPFSANLEVTLYRCTSGSPYRVRFQLNEVPVDAAGCEDFCPWSHLKTYLSTVLVNCSLELCNAGARWPRADPVTALVSLVAASVAAL